MLSACASLCVFSLHVSLARVCACTLKCEKATAATQPCLRSGRDTFHIIWQHRRAANIQTAFPQHSINAWTRSYVFQGRLPFLEVREVGVETVDKPFFSHLSTRCLMFDGILFESSKGACVILLGITNISTKEILQVLSKRGGAFLLFCCCSFVINNGRLSVCFCSFSAPLLLTQLCRRCRLDGSLQMAALGSKHQGHFTVYFKTHWSHMSHPFAATPPPNASVHTHFRGRNVRHLEYDKKLKFAIGNFKVQLASNKVKNH